jgi:REP element-mobilizing transposase RayT
MNNNNHQDACNLPQRRRLPHGIPAWVPDDAVHFVTINCAERGKNQLCESSVAEIFKESLLHRQKLGHLWMRLCLLMPDHIHLLASFSRNHGMKGVIAKWKEWTAKQTGIRWQTDFFEHRLRRDESFEEKAHYIRMNPVRKGLVARPEEWPYVWDSNTFGDFRGW